MKHYELKAADYARQGKQNCRAGCTKEGNRNMPRLTLDKPNKKILGVCAGLANWSVIDVTIVRVLFVAATLIGVGSPILIYILLAMILD